MKKQYSDSRTSREVMSRLRTDLRDVQNIMFTNIQDVMTRGETLQGINKFRSFIFVIDWFLFRTSFKSNKSCFNVSTIS